MRGVTTLVLLAAALVAVSGENTRCARCTKFHLLIHSREQIETIWLVFDNEKFCSKQAKIGYQCDGKKCTFLLYIPKVGSF